MKSNYIYGVADQSNDSYKRLDLCDSSSSDIISNLPEDIIHNIMIRLPIEDAARTTVLSKKWKIRWTCIPQIDIIFDDYPGGLSENLNQPWFHICKILSLHHGPLHKFRLIASDPPSKDERCFIDQIMIFLSGKDVQKITLKPAFEEPRYILPSYFFQCLQLTDLYLLNCEFSRLPHGFIGFSKLTRLSLLDVTFSVDDFRVFISKSPFLQELYLIDTDHNGHSLEIDAPNLKLLYFERVHGSIIFKNVPVLSAVKIGGYNASLGQSPDIVKVFNCLPVIEYLDVDADFLVDSSKGFIPKRLPTMLSHLKFLELDEIHFNSVKEVQCALLLIKSSPKLQKLMIGLEECVVADDAVEQLLKLPSVVEDSFNQLQEVTLKTFNGLLPELEFVKFLLAKSLVLKKIVIRLSIRISSMRVVKIRKAVTQFQRASPEAKIVFLKCDGRVPSNLYGIFKANNDIAPGAVETFEIAKPKT